MRRRIGLLQGLKPPFNAETCVAAEAATYKDERESKRNLECDFTGGRDLNFDWAARAFVLTLIQRRYLYSMR